MKKILITGANSYIGTSFETWVNQWPDQYKVDTLDLIDNTWRNKSFKGYDVIYHVAGIAHIKQTEENQDLYYKVNRDLAVEVAKRVKEDGGKHFIFLSSMSVYGIEKGVITKDTIPNPKSHYGISKYEAEQQMLSLVDKDYKLSILRPPMVYGKGCKGNFVRLNQLTNKISVFPKVTNKRSMIYIDNLSEFVKRIIDEDISGVLCPQNSDYVCTSEMIKLLCEHKGKKPILLPGFQSIVSWLAQKNNFFSKVFGDLIYSQEVSNIGYNYQTKNLNESIMRSI